MGAQSPSWALAAMTISLQAMAIMAPAEMALSPT
jgi:hypothetical protein